MRLILLCGVWGLAAACGVVKSSPDAPTDAAVPGTTRWARSLSALFPTGVATSSSAVVVTGYMSAPVELDGTTLSPAGKTDSMVATFGTNGAHLYSTSYGGAGDEYGFLGAADQGVPIVHGVSYGNVNLGTGPVDAGGTDHTKADGFVGRYGRGTPGWVQRIVGPAEEKLIASTLDADRRGVWAAGFFEATARFNGTDYVSTGASRDIIVARFDAHVGNVTNTILLGSSARDEATAIATSGADIIVGGNFEGTLVFSPTVSLMAMGPELDTFIAKLTATGDLIWAVRHGGLGVDRDPAFAVDSAGDIYVSGQFQQTIAFGQQDLISKGESDLFIAKLRGSDGNVLWATSIGSALGDSSSRGFVLDGDGNLAVLGVVGGPVDGEPSAGGSDAMLTVYDAATGTQRWRRTFSTSGADAASGLMYGSDGDLYLTVSMAGDFDFGAPLIGTPGAASVLLRLAP